MVKAEGSAVTAAGEKFPDTKNHWASTYIAWAVEQKLAAGYEDGKFRPDRNINEAEFLALLLRAYGNKETAAAGAPWYEPYYSYAKQQGWPLIYDVADDSSFRRGQAALLMVSAATGKRLTEKQAIQWLLDEKLTTGRTAPTVAGYYPQGTLTRAEALTFLYRLSQHSAQLSSNKIPPEAANPAALRGVAIGDTFAKTKMILGEAQRSDETKEGFTWQVYNDDYSRFAMIGTRGGKIVALFSNTATSWEVKPKLKLGITLAEAISIIGSKNGQENEFHYTYVSGSITTTLFIDRLDGNRIIGILQTDSSAFGQSGNASISLLQESYEQQSFDLANAERSRRGISLFTQDAKASKSARGHSKDMADRKFFNHENPDGKSPFDRMKAQGITYRSAAENIAAGQTDSMYAHFSWMNSPGHRSNLLSKTLTKLGTGVAFGGQYGVYYTQNFYTP
ncbi:CAP domain-containing protein [Paenibacillus gorillae]|uniref:CAP domain-containing protein n=1 Tax=Paenibacillus gorillae TaxID=1243662 RepID=UPI0004BC7E3C|nr:CAP domain-containing protein [Paenibacillus gorillae]